MKISTILLFFFAFMNPMCSFAKKTNDSLLLMLFENAEKYDRVIRHYESDIYIKGSMQLQGKNRFMNRVPQKRTFARGVKDYFSESYGSLSYTAPFTFDRDVKAISGTFPEMKQESDMVLDFFSLTLYRESLIYDHLLSPFSHKNDGFYKYELDSIRGDRAYYTYTPKYTNTQLVKGYFVLNRSRVLVEEAYFEGTYEFMKFKLKVIMGSGGFMTYLPNSYEFDFRFNFIGNKLSGQYKAKQNYTNVEVVYEPPMEIRKSRYDLSNRYSLTVDTAKVLIDSTAVAEHRFIPLEPHEQNLYERWARRQDSIKNIPPRLLKEKRSFGDFAEDVFFSHSYLNLGKKLGRLRMNPLLDVGLFNYSSTRGYSYRQDFKYVYQFPDQREILIRPRLGYNIKFKQLFWRLIARYTYLPRKQGAIQFEIGNGNRIRGAIQDVQYSGYFSDNYMIARHEIELLNGLNLTTGIVFHSRQPWKMTAEQASESNLRLHYKSFSPNVRLEWTPGQYFYMDRNKKVDVYSPYPTIAIDYEAGLKGVLGSTSRYSRVELDISYEWDKDTMHKFSWRAAGGKFLNKDVLEFVDYHSFKKHYLPETWEDELGGRFTLLDSHWYNESMYYLRGHLIYESPLLLLGHLSSKYIQRERLYASALRGNFYSSPEKRFHNYFEIGYGFATHIFDLGFYGSFSNKKFQEFGVKYNFTLFH